MTEPILEPDFDWEAEPAPPSFEEEYQALRRAVRRAQGFGLLFVQCSPAIGHDLIHRLQSDLSDKPADVISFTTTVPGNNLFRAVRQRLDEHPDLRILFIQGLEYSLFAYEDIQRLSGWTSAEIYSCSWQGVPPLMQNLNWLREDFRDNFPQVCLVFLVPRFLVDYLVHRAPDFFDWRSGLFEFPNPVTTADHPSRQVWLAEHYEQYGTMPAAERRRHLLELQDLLAEPGQPVANQGRLLVELGKIFMADHNYAEAIARYEQAIVLVPDYSEAWYRLGIAHAHLGNYEAEIASYDQALMLNPQDASVWNSRGYALFESGHSAAAIADFDRAIALNPHNDKFWSNRGAALGTLGQFQDAMRAYEAALAINPNNYNVWFDQGVTLFYLGRYEEAIASYERALAINPEDYEALTNRGAALWQLDRLEQAIASCDQAIALNPDYDEAWATRAHVLADSSPEAAIASYEQALAINPENPEVWYGQACCYAQQGLMDLALDRLSHALHLDRDRYAPLAQSEKDFQPLQQHPQFQALLAGRGQPLLES